ncbi:MAG: TOBE domain-containing protein [Proteobacteria bacterium]|nr:TOBE domain-containing protein [Pseudomonadota bacterium]
MEEGSGGHPATVSFAGHSIACQAAPCSSSAVIVAIRPEDVAIAGDHAEDSDGVSHLVGTVKKISFTGREAKYVLECEGGISLTVNVARPTLERLTGTGGKLKIALPHESLLFFDKKTQRRL